MEIPAIAATHSEPEEVPETVETPAIADNQKEPEEI